LGAGHRSVRRWACISPRNESSQYAQEGMICASSYGQNA
jgi:hypothetical protein